jgi:hypothetical protein
LESFFGSLQKMHLVGRFPMSSPTIHNPSGDERSEEETAQRREQRILARLLATPPDHRTKPKTDASPKKRGRPPKELEK